MGNQRLRPVERLRCPRAYQRVFEQGEKLVGSLFILYVLPTSEPYSRLGIAVSKRLGNAVVRNRIKRRVREAVRLRSWYPRVTWSAWHVAVQLECHWPSIHSSSSCCCSAASVSSARGKGRGAMICRWVTWVLMTLLRGYQCYVSPLFLPTCRFHPTCSEYAMQAIAFYGPVRGLSKAIWRLLRCHPLSRGGVDLPTPAGDCSSIGRS